ncbi:MAG: exonuclease SbcCD subunit D [Pseudomonadales bacterium]|jgi:DNA repair protein SbcD/Mre11|nr:exonuclease SbcCD subunit D [Pseudomonadales bacterium]MDP4639213.1 exonuclease SbcCD subunit D [Pseudomonadales bacterium]MDP4876510.1 exonuclease SbcCD subunit D [Pseudomonadales bacterium]MDP4912394.1 exonuclease SbcCD subunit D [Pseudomonadales bacterium]MDP5057841.1 exonuclease SbcCD subunit D [Pseudomonadales bacterium]
MKILHTADWHIGRQFHNVSLLDDQRHVLAQIIDLLKQEAVDVMIIAGDIYDRSVPPADAVKLLDETLHTIVNDLGIPVLVIAGNHDSPERLGFGARQLLQAGLHIAGPLQADINPYIHTDAHGQVVFYSLPYMDPATLRNVFEVDIHGFDEAMAFMTDRIKAYHGEHHPNSRSVVICHCFLAGGATSESERPLSVGGADQVSAGQFAAFNYTALGHLHQPQAKGEEHIRYAGSLLKYSFSEIEKAKSVTLVDLQADGSCQIDEVLLAPLRDMRVVEDTMERILAQGKLDPHNHDYVLVRLLDTDAILDPMGKLRSVYPNVLHLEKPNLRNSGERMVPDQNLLQKNGLQLFEDFFRQVTTEELRDDQRQHLVTLIDELQHPSAEHSDTEPTP